MTGTLNLPTHDGTLPDLGKKVISRRLLEPLREYLGLSRNAMAELLHTSPITYTKWEVEPDTRIWPSTAQRVGAFYKSAQAEIHQYEADMGKGSLKQLVPFHVVATYAGLPHELLLRWYREGKFEAVDLGILGLWVNKDEVHKHLTLVVPSTAEASMPRGRNHKCPVCGSPPFSLCRDPKTNRAIPASHDERKALGS